MEKCAKCGKNIRLTSSNWVERGGKFYHLKCPKSKVLDAKESQDYKQLTDKIHNYLNTKPSDWLIHSGLNFKKVVNQIKLLKDKGYSYEDQIYALDHLVETKGAFFGYTHVVNNIQWIIEQKHKREEQLASVSQDKVVQNQSMDLSKLMTQEDDW